jgi:dTDP-4-amino-4,6-dideoxygalactose transaminase
MNLKPINVTKTYLPDRKKLDKYIDQIYESTWLTNNGPLVQELEKRLKEYLGVKNLILVSNGTLALQVAYKALDIKGSAITTPFSFIATASSLVWEGIKPVFADIDEKTWNLDPANIEPAIQKDTSAIVPVHVFGNPCEVEQIDKIAKNHNLKVIYDAAHAFGVKYKGESVLNWGDVSTLSFHATKLFHTIEGGAIITSDDELAKKIRLMINFGITGPETIDYLGINAKMNEFQAAMGLCVLDEIDTIIDGRKSVWHYYKQNLPINYKRQKWNFQATQNYHYFPIVFNSELELKLVQNELNKIGIYPRRYFFPALDSLVFLDSKEQTENCGNVSRQILCLPIWCGPARKFQKRINEILGKYFRIE